MPEAMGVYAAQLIDIQCVRGSWSELSEMADLMAAAAAENPGLPVLRPGLAVHVLRSGRDDDAHSVIDDDIEDGFASSHTTDTLMLSMGSSVKYALHLGQRRGCGPAL